MRTVLKTMVGVGLSEELDKNEIELRNGIEVARAGHADILAVGNEVMLREDLTEDQLIDYIERAKAAVPGVPVGTVDAYFLFENHPRVAAACDTLLVNCYPFWESCPAEYSLLYMKEMYRRAQNVAMARKSSSARPVGRPSGLLLVRPYPLTTTRWSISSEHTSGRTKRVSRFFTSRRSTKPGKSAMRAMSARTGAFGTRMAILNSC